MLTGHALIDQMNRLTILPNSLAIWGMGQMGLAIKGPDGILYIDPFLSEFEDSADGWWTRAFAPPLTPDQLGNATAILCSHEHGDHLDPMTVGGAALASPDTVFYVTGWSREIMRGADIADARVIVPREHETMTIPGTSARLTALPSAHYTLEDHAEHGHRWLGFLIEWNGVTLYHAGDTIIYQGYVDMLRALPPIDVAMLPVNGRDWYREADVGAIGNLWPAEAARLASDMGWDMLIIGHNDLFRNNAIPMGSVAQAMDDFAPRQAYKLLQPGELYYYVK